MNKFITEIIVQELTCNGWEDSCSELNWKDAKATKKDYLNAGVNARIIERRSLNPELVEQVKAFQQDNPIPADMTVLTAKGAVKYILNVAEQKTILMMN